MPEARILSIRTGDAEREHRLPSDPCQSLADWLAREGFPLNTRCGGRGLCRGCQVELDGHPLKACLQSIGTLPSRSRQLVIPKASHRDERLDGISVFELGFKDPPFQRSDGIGLALDIGTTTVAGTLWDLSDGRCLAEAAIANAQRRYGDNVLARIEHARSLQSTEALHDRLIRHSIQPLFRQLVKAAGLDAASVGTAVASGNTVMLHTLAGEPLDGFAAYPFEPVFLEGRILTAEALGFEADFPVKLVPNLGAFVGGDVVAGALASGMCQQTAPTLLIDFGTNGEILLGTGSDYLATATAAGPAFEGGRLHCGRAAASGVIGGLSLTDGAWETAIISGERNATGLSGAAYIDFMAEARACGLLNRMGRFEKEHSLLDSIPIDGTATPAAGVAPGIHVTETDIAELMQAKAAILGGARTLLEEAGLTAVDLQTIYIAGGFGYHLNPAHAIAIGLLPNVPQTRVRVIGNSSLAGASLLLQARLDPVITDFRRSCHTLELNQIENFEDNFIDCMPLEAIE